MTYRKFNADRIFTGNEFVGSDQVIITDSKGKIRDIVDLDRAGEDIETLKGVICPGFINCHCHLELSHLKGVIPEQIGMIPFLLSVMSNRNFPTEVIRAAIEQAGADMLKNGIVAVGDICNTSDTLAHKRKASIQYHNFIEALGIVSDAAAARFDQARNLYQAFSDLHSEKMSIVPHAPYSVSSELLTMIDAFDTSSILSIHNQESAAEHEFFLRGEGEMRKLFAAIGVDPERFLAPGVTSVQHYLPSINREHSMLLVHNVTTDASDLDWIRKNEERLPELYWCLCVNANLYISGILPDISLLAKDEHAIVLGTDSLASNHRLDILSELQTIQTYFPGIAIGRLLQWATYNGAKALRMEKTHGSIEKDKHPGLLLLEHISGDDLRNATVRRLI